MSLLDKAIKFRNRFLNQHLIGKSLGLLNRAESFIFLKNSENINFDYIIDSKKEKKENNDFNNIVLKEPSIDESSDSKKKFYLKINKISNEIAKIIS